MSKETLGMEILNWATSGMVNFNLDQLDRDSPSTLTAFRQALAKPADIATVEHIENLAKQLWSDVLEPSGYLREEEAIACSSFFSRLGFLFKYKPYGVKIATPFGYSLFDLRDGQGFSFQLHVEPKLEGFHILQHKARSLIYISTKEEWLKSGEAWAHSSLVSACGDADPPFVWRPESGDVVEVSTTEVVHSVLGCVLEEYASCSVDAVERLYDQNARSEVTLPAEHPNVSHILNRCRSGQPLRRVERVSTGWSASNWADGDAAIKVEGDLWGSRVRLSSDAELVLPASGEFVKIIVAVDRAVEIQIAGRSRYVAHGSFACVPPGLDISILSSEDCSVAVHCVSRTLIQADWTR